MDCGLIRHTDSNSAVEKGANRTSTLTSTKALFARKDNLLQCTWLGSSLRWLNDWLHPWPVKHINWARASMQTSAGNIFLPSIFISISTNIETFSSKRQVKSVLLAVLVDKLCQLVVGGAQEPSRDPTLHYFAIKHVLLANP